MKILHVYKTYLTESYGGIEQAIYQLALATQPLGVQNRVFCLSLHSAPPVVYREEAEIFRYKKNVEIASTGFSWSAIAGFKACVAWADIVHYQFPWPFGDMLHFFSTVQKPSLVSYQSDIIRQKFLLKCYLPLQRQFLKSMDKIVVSSENYLASSQVLKLFRDKISVIPIGIDANTYPVASREKLESWKQRVGESFFLFVGALRYYKGLPVLLEACKKHPYPVVIAGSGPIEHALKKVAKKFHLDRVIFLGHISEEDKSALLMLSKAIVFPSHLRSEAYGVSLLEGAMFKKPLISSEIGTGTSFINIEGETGVVVPPSDSDALGYAMQRLWEDPALCKRLGENAYRRYQSLFTADKMAKAYLSIYEELVLSTVPI